MLSTVGLDCVTGQLYSLEWIEKIRSATFFKSCLSTQVFMILSLGFTFQY